MDALLLVAHGSKIICSNEEIKKLTRKLAQDSRGLFDIVECAFLEFAKPSILEGASICALKGAKEITLLPYLLSSGRHLAKDIPAELEKIRKNYPQVRLKITPYLGAAEEISEVLIKLCKQASDAGCHTRAHVNLK